VVQVARFDPWKDPIGVVDAFYKAKNKIPDLQLAFLGLMIASDDPEAMRVFKKVQRYAKGDPDIFLFAHLDQIKDYSISTFVSAFQTSADVIMAKSIREGFGLVVTEAMWKGKPVIGGNVGGIKRQIVDGKSGFLVNSSDEAADRIVELLQDPARNKKMGVAARRRVRENFLMPRLLLDYLKLFEELVHYKIKKQGGVRCAEFLESGMSTGRLVRISLWDARLFSIGVKRAAVLPLMTRSTMLSISTSVWVKCLLFLQTEKPRPFEEEWA
jgi:glycosyltransferase involved in cell wall biosynthesis